MLCTGLHHGNSAAACPADVPTSSLPSLSLSNTCSSGVLIPQMRILRLMEVLVAAAGLILAHVVGPGCPCCHPLPSIFPSRNPTTDLRTYKNRSDNLSIHFYLGFLFNFHFLDNGNVTVCAYTSLPLLGTCFHYFKV